MLRLKTIFGLAATGALVATAAVALSTEPPSATVTAIIDGDTIDVLTDGQTQRIRLLNIDTPEVGRNGQASECLAAEATDFLSQTIPVGSEVTLRYDRDRTDRYGRELAAVFNGDVLVNAEIAAAGFGRSVLFEPNSRYYADVQSAEAQARAGGLGIFGVGMECLLAAPSDRLAWQELSTIAAGFSLLAPGTDYEPELLAAYSAQVAKAQRLLTQLTPGEDAKGDRRSRYYTPLLESAFTSQRAALQRRVDQQREDIEQAKLRLENRPEDKQREEATVQRPAESAAATPTPPAPVQQPAPTPPRSSVRDTYTGCRDYSVKYPANAIDDKGQPYTRIDCVTKTPI